MDTKKHLIIGLIAGGLTSIVLSNSVSNLNILNVLISTFFGAVGSLIPDGLEPPTSWRHRQFFHSWRMLTMLTVVFVVMIISTPIWSEMVLGFVILGTLAGYISHLIADATTKAGLPP